MRRLCHVDAIVVRVGTDPFDPDNALLEVEGGDKPIVIAFDIVNTTRSEVTTLAVR
jgi:hypothetical protein